MENREEVHIKQGEYTKNHLLFYPGARLSPEEKGRMDRYEIGLDDLTIDLQIYSMSRQIENNFQTFYSIAEEVVGSDKALAIAHEIGRRYGGEGYAKLLVAIGRAGYGDPSTMSIYQDLVHSIRGPKHAAALFSEYDDTRCIVRRKECIYYSESNPANGKYTEAFEAGCFEGYMAADKNLLRVEVVHCRYQGADGCEQHWVFKSPDDRQSSEVE